METNKTNIWEVKFQKLRERQANSSVPTVATPTITEIQEDLHREFDVKDQQGQPTSHITEKITAINRALALAGVTQEEADTNIIQDLPWSVGPLPIPDPVARRTETARPRRNR